jgi:hypothetical protein
LTIVMATLDFIIRGADASALGTRAMDTVRYRRHRDGGAKSAFLAWEYSSA